jgi:hypothetical protein
MSGEGYDHSSLEMLKGNSGKADQGWVSDEIRTRIFGSLNAISIFLVIFTWFSSPGYNSIMLTSAYFLFILLFSIVKFRKNKELKMTREHQVNELKKK